MNTLRRYLTTGAECGKLTAQVALQEPNVELRRAMIECIGTDRLFTQLDATVIDEDTNGLGDKRRLLRIPMKETVRGYIQAVHVVCPTTRREYYLPVPSTMTTCQDAVASTFELRGDEYHPIRES